VTLDEIDRVQRLFVAMVLDRDGLDRRQPVGFQQRADLGEIRVEIGGADRLDHLDRHQLVVLPAQVPVVLLQQGDPILQPGLGDTRAGQRMLLGRDRGGGHMAAVAGRGMDREAAPTGADLHHPVARLQAQLAAQAVELAL